LERAGVDVIGVNCGVGPQVALQVLETMRPLTKLPLSGQPNAGLPARVEGRFFYFATPEYFGTYARQAADLGIAYIGGCCGTTPAHIAAMRAALKPASHKPAAQHAPAQPAITTRPHAGGSAAAHALRPASSRRSLRDQCRDRPATWPESRQMHRPGRT